MQSAGGTLARRGMSNGVLASNIGAASDVGGCDFAAAMWHVQ